MECVEIEKSKVLTTVGIVDYVENSVVIKTIIRKSTGSIRAMSFDTGQGLTERTSPFDTYVQIMDGRAEIVINNTSYFLITGQSIVIPAHTSNYFKSEERFKMILTVIKSGYDI